MHELGRTTLFLQSGVRKDNSSVSIGLFNRANYRISDNCRASVIDFLLTEGTQHKRKVAFFFSRFDEPESLKAETALRAVVRQIINIQDISGDTKIALEDIQNTNEDLLTKLLQLLELLLVRKQQPTWMVIDGLDEWPRDERRKVIEALSTIMAAGPEVKVFATSRDPADLVTREAFPGLHQILMNCLEAQEGMAQLVSQAVQKCLDAEELLATDQRLIADIKKTLNDNADGMYDLPVPSALKLS